MAITLANQSVTLRSFGGKKDSRYTQDYSTSILPELPRTRVDTTYTLPTGGTTWNCTDTSTGSVAGTPSGSTVNGCSLTYALANSALGDVIVLTAGATYSGKDYTLPVKSTGSGWIYIISSGLASLPYGTRVTAADVTHMATILGAASASFPVIDVAQGAGNYRLCGLEISKPGGAHYAIQRVQSKWPTNHDILLDRCYVRGADATYFGALGFYLGGIRSGAIECRFDYIGRDERVETQCVLFTKGVGPHILRNNYMAAGGQCIMAGGEDWPEGESVCPSDLEIVGNYLTAPSAWAHYGDNNPITPGTPDHTGVDVAVKNLFELKCAQRVLFEGNHLNNMYYQDQGPTAVVITPRNQPPRSDNAWCRTRDITMRMNKLTNVSGGFGVLIADSEPPTSRTTLATQRVEIRHNFIHTNRAFADYPSGTVSENGAAIQSRLLLLTAGHATTDGSLAEGLVVEFNTCIGKYEPHSGIHFEAAGSGSVANHWETVHINGNIIEDGTAGVLSGASVAEGTATLNQYASTWTCSGNVFPRRTGVAVMPAGNTFITDPSLVGYVNYQADGTGNYALAAGSTFEGYHGGLNPGCDYNHLTTILARYGM